MKKILFGSAAAILSVIGMSSFKTARPFTASYFFKVDAESGSRSVFLNDEVTFLPNGNPGTDPCNTGTAFKCVVGFTALQVTKTSAGSSNYKLITSSIAQPDVATTWKRTSI